MPDPVVVVYYNPEPLASTHLCFKKSQSRSAFELAREAKRTSFGDNVFIEEEGRPATINIGCNLCDDRQISPLVER